mmetsp:Transcript_37883/g.125552  ORF Transcript_37883/g.125552 Transcript_37883/m.125552 type:complete len:164 (+) Transcript_37883:57-548(+)
MADEERPVQRALVVLPPRHMTAAPRHRQSRSARLRGQQRPSDDRLVSSDTASPAPTGFSPPMADAMGRPLEQPCSESAPTRCSRSEPCAPPAPAPPAPLARTVSVPASTPADAPLCDVITDDRAKRCSASYCLRRDKHGKDRFGFPRQHHPHADHLAARRLLA